MNEIDWDYIYPDLLTAFPGWTWEYIDENMTIPRYNAIIAYWKLHPPAHVMTLRIAQMLGYTHDMVKSTDSSGGGDSSGAVYWDESFYKDTPQTPHQKGAAESLKNDFAAAGGRLG